MLPFPQIFTKTFKIMTNLEKLYTERVKAKEDARQAQINAGIKDRDERMKAFKKFFDQISFLNNYGYKWEILSYCNNGNDCCRSYYDWRIVIIDRTIKTSPFENIICKEINGVVKGKWEPTMLGSGRHVKGQDKDGWFTVEQLIVALS